MEEGSYNVKFQITSGSRKEVICDFCFRAALVEPPRTGNQGTDGKFIGRMNEPWQSWTVNIKRRARVFRHTPGVPCLAGTYTGPRMPTWTVLSVHQ